MLDPLFQLNSQNVRLTENTQRQSDQLRSQQLKEKEKGKKANSVDSAELSAESNLLGDDMLGSMDPDLMGGGGGGSAALFKKLWEETVEKEPDSRDEGGAPEPQDVLREEEPAEPAAPPAAPAAQPAGVGMTLPPSVLAPEKKVDEPPAARKREKKPEVVVQAPPPTAAAAAPGSLLDLSEGFLLHESRVDVEGEAAPAAPADLEPLSPDLEKVLSRLLQGDASSAAWPALQRLLGRFGVGVLGHCAQAGVKVCLLPRGSRLEAHPAVRNALGGASASGGAYLPETRMCLVEEECLREAPRGFHPALFYFAQAYDHALGGEEFASLQSAAVKASFEACRRGLPGHAFSDGMAAESPVHYFAQAVEAYLSESDCEDPLWTRDDLYDLDRSMFSYVEYLLKQGNRGR